MKCEICGAEKKNLILHVRTKHGISMEEYEASISEGMEELDSIEEGMIQEAVEVTEVVPDKISPKDRQRNIFAGSTEFERDINRPLKSFLDEFEVTEEELRSVTRQYKGGRTISATQNVANKLKLSEKTAKQISDEYKDGNIDVYESEVAGTLVEKFGFKCVKTVPKTDTSRKKWILSKSL